LLFPHLSFPVLEAHYQGVAAVVDRTCTQTLVNPDAHLEREKGGTGRGVKGEREREREERERGGWWRERGRERGKREREGREREREERERREREREKREREEREREEREREGRTDGRTDAGREQGREWGGEVRSERKIICVLCERALRREAREKEKRNAPIETDPEMEQPLQKEAKKRERGERG
jgi:hypothetical protein